MQWQIEELDAFGEGLQAFLRMQSARLGSVIRLFRRLGSQIEKVFMGGLLGYIDIASSRCNPNDRIFVTTWLSSTFVDEISKQETPGVSFNIVRKRIMYQWLIRPQFIVQGLPYRLDFGCNLTRLGGTNKTRCIATLGFECDGYDYHVDTPERLEKFKTDRERDRKLQRAGFPINRFSGSEIMSAARNVGERAFNILLDEALKDSDPGMHFMHTDFVPPDNRK